MGASIRFSATSEAREWDALVASSPGATGFHDWSWLQLQSELFGWRFIPLIISHGSTSVGVFPVLVRPGRIPRPADPPFPYVGPLVPDDLLVDTLRAFRSWQLRHGVPISRFDLGPAVAVSGAELTDAGVEWSGDRTYVVDLADSSSEQLVAGMHRNAKRSLRAAAANGVEVRPARPGETTTFLPRVLSESYTSRGVPSPYPQDIGERIERWAVDRDDVYIAAAVVAGQTSGVIVALGSHPVVSVWAGGTLREHRAANPSTSLYHDVLRWSLDRGHTAADLVGRVDDGIARFKTALGGIEKPYTRITSSPLPRAARDVAVRLWQTTQHHNAAS
ncbi:GNAT family N-acetyltransferase [Curtobacterium sp. MCPF17_002]|uniref:GNAT family N-acetyltransferase n=1 Tax=Curtobacterium sp. MCPF17_002 TaxID=2175645 RepID=UPI000DA9E682|nr:GNAT family N-acetyltransferase [Curtobacterium sp. MCPF17_002]WIB77735.1 GNAT family N-acetyltransferase [Curtobacterium sp. MCPF17_002]